MASRKRRLGVPATGRKPNSRTCLLLLELGRFLDGLKPIGDLRAASGVTSRAAILIGLGSEASCS